MKNHKNNKLTKNAQNLRKNMTNEERKLWYMFLKSLPVTINRQKVFDRYIADFYCAEYRFIIEIDGSQHFLKEGAQKDRKRDKYFESIGIKVLRYSNYDINYCFDDVCQDILNNMGSKNALASPEGEAVSRTAD